MAKAKDSPGQKRIDFSRGEELAMLANIPLKPVYVTDDSGRQKLVKARDLYDALRAIDDHGYGCWPSFRRLCAVSRMSRSALIRAIRGLELTGLLVVTKRPYTSNRYVIQWTVIRARCEEAGVVPRGNHPSSRWEPPRCPVGTITVQEPLIEPPPPPTPKESQPNWKAVEAEIVKAGIGNAKECCRAMRERGLTADDSLDAIRAGQATIAKLVATGKLKRPAGALHWFLTTGSWPFDMHPQVAAEQQPSHQDHDKAYWPIIRAMSHQEQAALLPDEQARDDLARLGPEDVQNRYRLVDSYVVAMKHGKPKPKLAVATA